MGKVSFSRIFILFASVVLWMAALRSTSEWGFNLSRRQASERPVVEEGLPAVAAAIGRWF